MPETWTSISTEIMGKVIPQTPMNEEYVAVKKIQKLLNQGKSERDIALIWNGSLGGSEKAQVKKGINRYGVKYDTGAYSVQVLTAYASETN